MACFHPLQAYLRVDGKTGKDRVVFCKPGESIKLPCGQCIGCRLDHSLRWACRCMHEASSFDQNCFITLTYDDDHLPSDGSLVKADFQKFMKRLRKKFRGRCVRFFHCGEYGDKLGRPHYHALLFNLDFPDKELIRDLDGRKLYTSDVLSKLWKFGYSTVGECTFESAAYVARYCTKKVTGDRAVGHYVNDDGVLRLAEYATMSRRPGIGRDFFHDFSGDIFPWDEVIINGKAVKPPRYYDNLYQLEDVHGHAQMKRKRKEKAKRLEKDSTPARLRSREIVKEAQFKMLKRSLDNNEASDV